MTCSALSMLSLVQGLLRQRGLMLAYMQDDYSLLPTLC